MPSPLMPFCAAISARPAAVTAAAHSHFITAYAAAALLRRFTFF